MPAISSELISGVVAFLLTIFVLSYLIGDQFLFRAAIYIFVGVSAGEVETVVWYQVLTPQLIQPLLFGSGGERTLAIFPFFLTILLFAKAVPALSKLGTPSVAFMVGVGAAVAIGGAVTGTIFPQTGAAIDEVGRNSFEGVLMLFGTISTLIYFQFSAKRGDDGEYRRNLLTRIFSFIGKVFIAITFGVLFAGVYSAALTAFIERLDFLSSFITSLKTLWLP